MCWIQNMAVCNYLLSSFISLLKPLLELQKEMERMLFTTPLPPPIKEARLEVARSTREHNQLPCFKTSNGGLSASNP